MHYISHIPGELDALPFPRRIALMGCTGSIGCSTLRVLEAWKDSGKFHVEVLAAGRNIALLAQQAAEWRPPYLAVQDASDIEALRALLRQKMQRLIVGEGVVRPWAFQSAVQHKPAVA